MRQWMSRSSRTQHTQNTHARVHTHTPRSSHTEHKHTHTHTHSHTHTHTHTNPPTHAPTHHTHSHTNTDLGDEAVDVTLVTPTRILARTTQAQDQAVGVFVAGVFAVCSVEWCVFVCVLQGCTHTGTGIYTLYMYTYIIYIGTRDMTYKTQMHTRHRHTALR